MMIFIPCTKSIPMRTVMYAAATGAGIAINKAVNFGRNATDRKMTPITTPTRRAPMPMTSAREMLVEYVVLGSVPVMPDSRLPTPSALSAPCTTRKSVARGLRWETR